MADIKIERKKHSNRPIWPWILAILVLVGVAWWLIDAGDAEEAEVAAVETEQLQEERLTNDVSAIAASGPISEFVLFTETEGGRLDMGLEHEYTSEGLMKLQDALQTLAEERTDLNEEIRRQLDELERVAQEIQSDPESVRHADKIQEAFMSAANAMYTIEAQLDSDANVEEVLQAAEEINPQELTLEQKEQVRTFFEEASQALEKMNEEV